MPYKFGVMSLVAPGHWEARVPGSCLTNTWELFE